MRLKGLSMAPTSIRRRAGLWAALLLLAAVLPGQTAARPAQQLGFPQQAGFPRLEPVGSTGFSSPAVADLEGDGVLDVLTADSAGCVTPTSSAARPKCSVSASASKYCICLSVSRIIGKTYRTDKER